MQYYIDYLKNSLNGKIEKFEEEEENTISNN